MGRRDSRVPTSSIKPVNIFFPLEQFQQQIGAQNTGRAKMKGRQLGQPQGPQVPGKTGSRWLAHDLGGHKQADSVYQVLAQKTSPEPGPSLQKEADQSLAVQLLERPFWI